jgi:hypothetical protein
MELKETGKNVVARTGRNPVACSRYSWAVASRSRLAVSTGVATSGEKPASEAKRLGRLARELLPEMTVDGGLFRGTQCPSRRFYGSALLSKLLGSYKSELRPLLEARVAHGHTAIVDIGWADRDHERKLFTREVSEPLAWHNVIIEAHDWIDINLASRLRDHVAKTHLVRCIKTTDDIEKTHADRYSQLGSIRHQHDGDGSRAKDDPLGWSGGDSEVGVEERVGRTFR